MIRIISGKTTIETGIEVSRKLKCFRWPLFQLPLIRWSIARRRVFGTSETGYNRDSLETSI
ncbi:hypothetical protein LEP1GSC194_1020 [Leptospira alstonii serovar Sichuan str. 79601]|uniref:Uncharacterized protein n=1 Tax=Leptospira alstonii serovar Sichuan str. 79601 TaxID=1218565 RepID=M6CH92_9LEPT|nr:hypothetical protein LEP1GSC194_1020 [Leptospira alstonii serovar Sichuan str. 79601]